MPGHRYPISSGLKKFYLCTHPAKHCVQFDFGESSFRNGALGEDDRSSSKGKTLNDSEKPPGIHGK